jgi:cell division cycle 2-like protein
MDVNVYEEFERMEVIASEQHMSSKDPKEMTEQELRRQRLLDAEREMARRKENSRIELEARRMKRGEKRQHSPDLMMPDHSIVELSDESVRMMVGGQSDDASSQKSNRSRLSDEEMRELGRERSIENGSSDTSDTSTDDDDDDDDDDDSNDSNDSNKDSNDDSNDNSDYNNPSPLSVDQLAKSDRSDGDSPGHVDSNGAAKIIETNDTAKPIEIQIDLPPYFPAIQGALLAYLIYGIGRHFSSLTFGKSNIQSINQTAKSNCSYCHCNFDIAAIPA